MEGEEDPFLAASGFPTSSPLEHSAGALFSCHHRLARLAEHTDEERLWLGPLQLRLFEPAGMPTQRGDGSQVGPFDGCLGRRP